MPTELERVGVVGAGHMGLGIATALALGGVTATMTDTAPEVLASVPTRLGANLVRAGRSGVLGEEAAAAARDRVVICGTLGEAIAGAGLVLESIPEDLPAKQELFARLDALCPRATILATNTSSLTLVGVGARMARRERLIGCHFLNPADAMPLVEVVQGPETDPEIVDAVMDLWRQVGKVPIRVRFDQPGFVANRLIQALTREAIALVESGVASVEDVDIVAQVALGPRLAATGILLQQDLGSLDLLLTVAAALYPHLQNGAEPLPLLRELVARREVGLQAGRGFYDWAGRDPATVREELAARLLNVLRGLGGRARPGPYAARDLASGREGR